MVARQRKKSQGSGVYREVAITSELQGRLFAGPMQKKSLQDLKGSWQNIPPTMLNFNQLHNVLIVKSIASFSERKVCIFSLFSGF
jgi:hypothetical protein